MKFERNTMKRILTPTAAITGAFFLAAAPVLLPFPELFTMFPNIAELYESLESAARELIPDEIEHIVSALSDKLR